MRTRSRTRALAVLGAAALATGLVTAPPASAAGHAPVVLADGLSSVLQLAEGPGHRLYATDSFAGGVVEVDRRRGTVRPVAEGLGFTAGVASLGQRLFVTSSCLPDAGCPGEESNELLRLLPNGRTDLVLDARAFEVAANPDGQPLTSEDTVSNPYDVLALPSRTVYADAAGNSLVQVDRRGRPSVLTTFPVLRGGDCDGVENNGVPDGGCDPVPTGLALDGDDLWVSGLGGEVRGVLWRVDAETGAVERTWDRYPPLTDVAVAPDGHLYAASPFTNQVLKVDSTTGDVVGALSLGEEMPASLLSLRDGLVVGTVAFGPPGGRVLQFPHSAFSPAA